LLHELGVEAAVPDGLVEIAARLTVQRREPAVGGHEPGEHAEASLKCQHGSLTMTQTRQRHSEIEMAQRKEVLQADSQQGLFGSFVIPALSQAYHR
jgi:hypothetical protein